MTPMHPQQRPGADEIVGHHWPYDGPHGAAVTASAAVAVRQLVRYLSNATQHACGAPYAATVGSVVASLRASVEGQAQLLDQLARRLQAVADDPRLSDAVNGADARRIALDGAAALHAAQQARVAYAQALATANTYTSRLTGSSLAPEVD